MAGDLEKQRWEEEEQERNQKRVERKKQHSGNIRSCELTAMQKRLSGECLVMSLWNETM
jgi:hypothetical protein